MRQWVAPKATLSTSPKRVNDRWRARKDDAEMTVVVKGKSMRDLQQTCLKFPPIGPSEEYVERRGPGLSAQTLGDGAEKFIAEMMVVDVDQIILINIRHRLHHSTKIIADSEPRQVF
jgi:hypothetical protein